MESPAGYGWTTRGKATARGPPLWSHRVYIDQKQFDELFEVIRDGAQSIQAAEIAILVKLFESEVEASLSEPWMDHEYGLLKKGKWVSTRARVESLKVSFGGKVSSDLPVVPEDEANAQNHCNQEAAALPTSQVHDAELKALVSRLNARGGWILAVLIVLVLATMAR